MVTPNQKHAIDCVLSLFETGKLPSSKSYSTCTILPDGAGISYGKHQATDRANSLDRIVKAYIKAGGSHAASLQPFVARLEANETAKVDPKAPPAWAVDCMNVLKAAGQDPLMQKTQDAVFDEDYWKPAADLCAKMGLKTALAHLVIYDTTIHSGIGGVATIRKMFSESPPASGGSEHSYIRAYVNARRQWLATHPKPVVQKCVYRMDALMALVQAGNWDLNTPFVCRGATVPSKA